MMAEEQTASGQATGGGPHAGPQGAPLPECSGGRLLLRGNDAITEAAVRAGCRFSAGYPLTPATEILEYLAWRLPQAGGICIQAESELAAINMVYGAAATGTRALTPTSGLGLSLMQECLSQLCAVELPAVVVDMCRKGPGLGSLPPSQADYFLATRGAGHGDSRTIVLAPASVQEAADLTALAFDLADAYRNPVLILGDSTLAQIMEPVRLPPERTPPALPRWAAGYGDGHDREPIAVAEYRQDLESVEASLRKLERKYAQIIACEPRWEDDCQEETAVVVVAFGTAARIARAAVRQARAEGLHVSLFRPITLWPFPAEALRACVTRSSGQPRRVLVAEMNLGQMVDDVRLALAGSAPVELLSAHAAGFTPDEIYRAIAPGCNGR